MKEYQMFGELKRYLEEEFRTSHSKMYLYTEYKVIEVALFSIFHCDAADDIFWDSTELGTADYLTLLEELDERNEYPDIQMNNLQEFANRQTFSLVTCKGTDFTDRLLINWIAVNEKIIEVK